MGSNVSQDVAATDRQSKAIETRRNWTSMIISSVFGGAIAVIAAPTIAALMPVGAVGFIAGTTATGILGNIIMKVTGNAIDSSKIVLTINQYPIQQFYRETVVQYIGATLDSVITAIRTNKYKMSSNRVFFEVGDEFRFEGVDAKEQRRMFFDFSFEVVPLSGIPSRLLDHSIAASDLPSYERESTRLIEVGTNKHLLDGISGAAVEGALFGIAGGALATVFPFLMRPTFIETVPGKINVIVGMSSATGIAGPIRNLTFPSSAADHAALFVEFATEAQLQVNRLVRCALENGVGLKLDMKVGSTTEIMGTVETSAVAGEQHCQFYWDVSEKVNQT